MLKTGKIQRFDETRGYGFINPDEGGEDVFMHANDLLDEKYLYQAGRDVEFFVEMGEKGPKASEIRLIHQPSRHRLEHFGGGGGVAEDEPGAGGFRSELTDVLLDADGTLTADQIKRIRARIIELARTHGWIGD
ncbi:cold shock domain-containing protein [Streptomyces sp. 35G-GA-8]|uniref:cold-shock protein n=1 Tax=Streptomyces sp. 35G-GA-8 TaxID=2939434 RepID=UPI00201FB17E|nr:cold shock domain-containing protein [Streptomyces sp. 35G-GA-8]MCL7376624.1 cold shock domain-containing protein [Streptomyces sp. 35G-GA-8]